MVMGNGMRILGDGQGGQVLSRASEIEPVRGVVQFTVAAGPAMAVQRKRMFVDSLGQNAAGGKTLLEGDYSPFVSGGKVINNMQLWLRGLALRMHLSDHSALLSDAQIEILSNKIRVELKLGQTTLDLGLVAEWLGPYGSPTGLNNVINIRKFGASWGGEAPIVINPGVDFSLDFISTEAISTIITASKDVCIRAVLPASVVRQGEQAVRTA